MRNGFPEVVYSPGKSLEQVRGIVKDMIERTDGNIMATRADENVYKTIAELSDETKYYEDARIVVVKRQAFKVSEKVLQSYPQELRISRWRRKRQSVRRSWEIVWIGFMMSELQVSTGCLTM